MKLFIKIKSLLAITIGLVMTLVFFSEIRAITENPIDYINVYQISKNSPEWKFQSIKNFQKWNIIAGIIALLYVSLNGLSLFTKQVKIKYAILIIDGLLIITAIVNFCIWSTSGFDH